MSLSEEPFPTKSFGTAESGPVHCPQGYVSGDVGADKVNNSRQVSRLYVVDAAVEVAGAVAETVFDALILGAGEVSFSLGGWAVECRFASRDTQTPTMMEQTMRMTRAMVICASCGTLVSEYLTFPEQRTTYDPFRPPRLSLRLFPTQNPPLPRRPCRLQITQAIPSLLLRRIPTPFTLPRRRIQAIRPLVRPTPITHPPRPLIRQQLAGDIHHRPSLSRLCLLLPSSPHDKVVGGPSVVRRRQRRQQDLVQWSA